MASGSRRKWRRRDCSGRRRGSAWLRSLRSPKATGSTRFPLKGFFKGDIDVGIGVDVDMDVDSDVAVSVNWGSPFEEVRAP